MSDEKVFNKYRERGSMHWREMISRDVRVFNAFQQARYQWIIKTLGADFTGKKVLDLGCGDGALSYLLAREGLEVTGVDNEELGIKFANENLQRVNQNNKLKYSFVVASAYELPFPSSSFDAIVHCEVFEHLAEPEKMLAEAKRVLKPGGKFVMTTPYRLVEVPADPNHIKEYFPGEVRKILERYFSGVEIKLTHHVFWYGMYTYSWKYFGNRKLGLWLINALALYFGFNPFMIDYSKPTKFDIFAQILASGRKPQ